MTNATPASAATFDSKPFGLQYLDRNGRGQNRYFASEAARDRFIGRGLDSGAVSDVLATCDPA